MQQKKVIPVKYFYYGMLITVLFIATFFYFVWKNEDNERKLLSEKGVPAKATITSLYQTKTSRKASPNYYMDVAFFTGTNPDGKVPGTTLADTLQTSTQQTAPAGSASLTVAPLGQYQVQTIPVPGYQVYSQYRINDTVNVVFLPDNPKVIRLVR